MIRNARRDGEERLDLLRRGRGSLELTWLDGAAGLEEIDRIRHRIFPGIGCG